MAETREPQYQRCLESERTVLGLMSNQVWQDDPRRLTFVLAHTSSSPRCSAEWSEYWRWLRDTFGTRIVLQDVGSLTAVDFDPVFVKDVQSRMDEEWKIECKVHDMLAEPC